MECLTEWSYSLSGYMLPFCEEKGFEFRKYWQQFDIQTDEHNIYCK